MPQTIVIEIMLRWIRKLWWTLPVIALAAALMVTRSTLADVKKERETLRAAGVILADRLAVTKESLAGARNQIDDNNRRIATAAARLEADRRQAAADEARTAERWRGTQAVIASLEADSRRPNRKPCTISDEARRALEDL